MSSKRLTRALALSGSALALSMAVPGQLIAQQSGDVQIRPAAQSVVDSLDSLEQLLLASPEEANRLNFYVTPQYRRDRYEAYSESGQIFEGETLRPEFPIEVDSPNFTVDSTGIAVGADYLLDDQWIFGGQLSYTNADFNYDTPSELDALLATVEDVASNNGDVVFGDPVDREFDEYGVSISAGFIAKPWTALFTLGYNRRNIDVETRKNGALDDNLILAELIGVEADFNSDIYSADLGASYRLGSESLSLQPFASIGYQIEDIDGYSEEITCCQAASGSLRPKLLDPRSKRRNPKCDV